ncbi:hypothetical protein C0J56_10940 [Pseudomonas fluorescens]|nr:hypothetical protein C0J56_10940 [Pseudomonas fluorescens]
MHLPEPGKYLWREDLSPLADEATPTTCVRANPGHQAQLLGGASHPSGDKSPRHSHMFVTSWVHQSVAVLGFRGI